MRIKILIIAKSIDGGTGTFLLNLLKMDKVFPKGSFEINTVILEKPSYRGVSNSFSYYQKSDFYPLQYSFSAQNIIGFFHELTWVRKKIKRHNPQIILSVDVRCNLLAITSKILSFGRHKVIATTHIDLGKTIFDKSTPGVNYVLKFLVKSFYNSADSLVGVSKNVSKNLKNDFNLQKKVTTIYNGREEKNKPKLHFNKRKKIILTVGRLVEQKDHINLINAFKILTVKLPSASLFIASDGPKRKELENYVKNLKLTKNIKFLGWVKNINRYFKKSDLFVLSSKREGFAYVLIEAMSGGLPIVSTDTPYGPAEVLDNGKYGVIVPMNDPHSLQKAMYKLLTNKKLHDRYAHKAIVRSRYFSLERMLMGYKSIITKLVNSY